MNHDLRYLQPLDTRVCDRKLSDSVTGVKAHLGAEELTIKFVSISSDERISAVVQGKVDIVCGSTCCQQGVDAGLSQRPAWQDIQQVDWPDRDPAAAHTSRDVPTEYYSRTRGNQAVTQVAGSDCDINRSVRQTTENRCVQGA